MKARKEGHRKGEEGRRERAEVVEVKEGVNSE